MARGDNVTVTLSFDIPAPGLQLWWSGDHEKKPKLYTMRVTLQVYLLEDLCCGFLQ